MNKEMKQKLLSVFGEMLPRAGLERVLGQETRWKHCARGGPGSTGVTTRLPSPLPLSVSQAEHPPGCLCAPEEPMCAPNVADVLLWALG